jgi:hypothetical protein
MRKGGPSFALRAPAGKLERADGCEVAISRRAGLVSPAYSLGDLCGRGDSNAPAALRAGARKPPRFQRPVASYQLPAKLKSRAGQPGVPGSWTMRKGGLEPPHPYRAQGPQPCVSANSTTSAQVGFIVYHGCGRCQSAAPGRRNHSSSSRFRPLRVKEPSFSSTKRSIRSRASCR